MLDPTDPDASRTEPQQAQQAVRGHSGRARNGVNGRVNQTTGNLPDSVVVSHRGAVTLVRLSRPTTRNAMGSEGIAGTDRVFSGRPGGTRTVVWGGEGSRFCSGAYAGLMSWA